MNREKLADEITPINRNNTFKNTLFLPNTYYAFRNNLFTFHLLS